MGTPHLKFLSITDHHTIKAHEYIKKNTVDFIQFKYNLVQGDDTKNLIKATKEIIQSLAIIPDQISKTLYTRRAAKILQISELDLVNELQNNNSSQRLSREIKPQKTILRCDPL